MIISFVSPNNHWLTGSCSSLPCPASQKRIVPYITSLGKRSKFKIQITVSIEHVLLLHHHKIKRKLQVKEHLYLFYFLNEGFFFLLQYLFPYLFTWLCQVLAAAWGIFLEACGDLVAVCGSSSLCKDQIWVPCIPGKSLCLLLNCMPSSLAVLWVGSSPWMVRVTTNSSAGISAARLTLLISTVYSAAIYASKRKLSPVTFWNPEAFSSSGQTRPADALTASAPVALAPPQSCWVVSPSSATPSDFSILSRTFLSFLLASMLLPTQPFSLSLLQPSCPPACIHSLCWFLPHTSYPTTASWRPSGLPR